jgi:hypothetical protein
VGASGVEVEPFTVAEPQRPNGLHSIPDDFALNDTMRRWVVSTFPELDPEFETAQFASYWRAEGKRKLNWHEAWQKWIRDSAKRVRDRQPHGGGEVVPFRDRQQQATDNLFDRAMQRANARTQLESS